MITDLGKQQGLVAANIFAGHDSDVVPRIDTPLYELQNTVLPLTLDSIPAGDEQGDFVQQQAEEQPHGQLIDEQIDLLTEKVQSIMQITRHTVGPFVKQVYEQVVDGISAAKPLPHNVATMDFGELSAHPATADIMRTSQISALKVYNLPMRHGEREEPELVSMLTTGSSGFDQALISDLAKQPADFLVNVYTKYFREQTPLPISNNHDAPRMMLTMAVVSLIATTLQDQPPEDTGVDSESYLEMHQMLGLQARLRFEALARWRNQLLNQDRLIITLHPEPGSLYMDPQAQTNTVINGDLYANFIDLGGTPEHLIGLALLGDGTAQTTQAVMANADRYMSEYNRARQMADRESAMQQAVMARDYTRQFVARGIAGLPEEVRNHDLSMEQLTKITSDFINAASLSGFSEQLLYKTIRNLICKTVFAHTHSLQLLELMDEIERKAGDTQIDIRHVAYRAVIAMVVDNLMDQVDIVRS